MRQQRVQKHKRVADTRRKAREDEQKGQERPEIRKDVFDRWFKER